MSKSKPFPFTLDDDYFGTILVCAVRYSIGRRSYMPSLVQDFIRPLLPHLSGKALFVMERDIREADYYGDPAIDEPGWAQFLADVQNVMKERRIKNAESHMAQAHSDEVHE